MARQKTHKQFVAEIANINQNIEVLGDYNGARNRLSVRCKLDGHVWESTPTNLLKGYGCPKCVGLVKKTNEQFVRELAHINPNIEVLTEYKSARRHVHLKCKVDGFEWNATPSHLLSGRGCPKCSRRLKRSHLDFVNELAKINPNVDVLGEYKNSQTNLLVKCKLDGYQWNPRANSLIQGQGCPKCGKNARKTTDDFVLEMSELHQDIEVLGDYLGDGRKILLRCKKDGLEWEATPSHLLQGKGCPSCAKTGFDPSKTAWFYVYAFQKYLGFGITNSPRTRQYQHRTTFEKSNIEFKLLYNLCHSGGDIKQLESHLKKTLPIVNTGVDGFKTEAILHTDGELLYAEINKFKEIHGIL